MEWTIVDPAADPSLLAVAFALQVTALVTLGAALLGVILGEVYDGRAERFARFILGACIVEGLPLFAWGMATPGSGGLAGIAALLIALGLGAPGLLGAVESFARLVDGITDAVDDRVRRWVERERLDLIQAFAPGRTAEAGPGGWSQAGRAVTDTAAWCGRGGFMSVVAPDEVASARGAFVMGMAWAAMGWLGIHAVQGGTGGEVGPFIDWFAGLIRLLGVVIAAGAGLDLLVAALDRRRRDGGGGSDVGAGS